MPNLPGNNILVCTKTRRETELKMYELLALPTLKHLSEYCTIQANKIQSVEMRC